MGHARSAIILGLMLGLSSLATAAPPSRPRPNIVVIVADDLGYSDIGAFGGEIHTPNLDALAKRGVRLTDFHAAPTCSPTRSMLISGTDNHTAGVGAMAETRNIVGGAGAPPGWGYEGVLTNRVATIAERLKAAGYYTAMVGKWHLGREPDQNPAARGFESSFALLQGGHNHFGGGFGTDADPNLQATYTENGKVVGIPADFYSSNNFTTKMLNELKARPAEKPFFAYLAFTAPHSPLQALPADIARYKGRYDAGWAALRTERLARMKSLGIVPADTVPAPYEKEAQAWENLTPEQRKVEARKMEIYAAMVDRMDRNVGRLVAELKRSGAYSNTLFFFESDNGAAGEDVDFFARLKGMPEFLATRDTNFDAMGSKNSMVMYGRNWALAASAPYRLYKGAIAEGGTRVPAFVTYGGLKRQGAVGGSFADVMDVVPTLLDAAGVEEHSVVANRSVAPIRGKSMYPYLSGRTEDIHAADEAVSFELHGHRAVRQGRWKLVLMPRPAGTATWTLYDLTADPAEQNDLSERFPEKRQALISAWEAFAHETHIQDKPVEGL